MASSAIAGFVSQLYVKISNVYTKIGELKDVTLKITRDTIDVSSHSSSGWKDNLLGLAQWEATANWLYVESDSPQDTVYNALINRTLLNFRFAPQGDLATSQSDRYSGDGYITSWDATGPNNDAIACAINVIGAGALVKDLGVSAG